MPVDDGQAEINIFTVASGHLYEVRYSSSIHHRLRVEPPIQRFASIMILSVLRHTKSSVKFWFIENFLSPSFLVRMYPFDISNFTDNTCRNSSPTSRQSTASSTS